VFPSIKKSNKTDRQFEYSFQIMLWEKHEYAECNKKIIKSKRSGIRLCFLQLKQKEEKNPIKHKKIK
jgi:hypothetical protein